MTKDARKAVHQTLRVLGGTMVGSSSYRDRSDIIHGMLRMTNHLLPVADYPTQDLNDIFDTVLHLRSEEQLAKWGTRE